MREQRSISQILFGFLPQQTVDLDNRVWKVADWAQSVPVPVDSEALAVALSRAITPWSSLGRDGGMAADLAKGEVPLVLRADREGSCVFVEPFPRVYRCRVCRRIVQSDESACRCGARSWVQLPLVAFHECGAIDTPTLPRCPTHRETAVAATTSSRVSDLEFMCPACNRRLGRGTIPKWCRCAPGLARDQEHGRMHVNVHRAAQVFSPRHTVIVNPGDPALMRRLRGAPVLDWALRGFAPDGPCAGPKTWESVVAEMQAAGFTEALARDVADQAVSRGEAIKAGGDPIVLPAEVRSRATQEAVGLAAALELGQTTVAQLAHNADAAQRTLYLHGYPDALARAGLREVRLLTRFPVATLAYGYTRGALEAGASELVTFRDRMRRRVVYSTLAHTEGLLFLLDPLAVHAHLAATGLVEGIPSTPREAHKAILESVVIPEVHSPENGAAGDALLRLVHSYAHRAIRHLAPHCGVEREGLAEYLLPHHLAFVVYAAGRSDFVMGGLQATFERTLARFLNQLVDAEHRCAMDPRCIDDAAACAACLHLGEPSCRGYNRRLSRKALFGPNGYLMHP